MDDQLEDALESFTRVVNSPDLWIEDSVEHGQLKFLNNPDMAHFAVISTIMKTLRANFTYTGPGTGIPENEATMD